MCLEGFLAKAAKAPFRLLRNYGVPIGFGAGVVGVYASYLAATGQLPELERMKERLFDAELWQNTTSVLPALAVGAVGVFAAALAIENTSRKRKGKKPINIGKYLKRTFFPPKGIVDEERMRQMLDTFPDSSIAHRQIGDFFFRNDKPAEAMESYYHAMAARDREFLTKIPVFGTNGYVNGVAGRIRELESAARGGSLENSELLELAMRYFLLRDFDRAIEYFDKIDKEEDEFGFHILGSRLYSEAGKMAEVPKTARLSFGDTKTGRWLDKKVFFWRKQKLSREDFQKRADDEAMAAVDIFFAREDLQDHLVQVGDYPVYRIALNGFTKGFVALKSREHFVLQAEKKNEGEFERRVAGGKFRSVHPICIKEHEGLHYLAQFYEMGTPLSESRDPKIFEDAMRFAAMSDALMPTDTVLNQEYEPKKHFEARLSKLDDRVRQIIGENADFMFKYDRAFPLVNDGDWHALNSLFDENGFIIGLDKDGRRVSVGPVTAARAGYQYVRLDGHPKQTDEIRDMWVEEVYIPTYQNLAPNGRKIENTSLFLPHMMAKVMEKAITAYIFNLGKPSMQGLVHAFLLSGVHAGQRIRYDLKFRKFYSEEQKQCHNLQEAISTYLLS